MVVQHNMQAANANRMLNITTGAQSKSTEKLSSGYRINRAADDAAGLSISEKMRKQIRGLDKASSNAEDGVSAVQTAEGALTEVHSMLQRMNELATQAANGTNSTTDRSAIQDEISQLTTEIDRVAETTKFNETYLLKGDNDTQTNTINAHDAGLKGKLTDNGDGTPTFTANSLSVGSKVTIAGKEYKIVESSDISDYAAASGTAGKAADGSTALAAGDKIIKADGTTTELTATTAGTTTLVAGDTFVSGVTGKQTKIVTKDYTPTAMNTVANNIKGAAEGATVKIDNVTYTLSHTSSSDTTLTSDDIISHLSHGAKVEIDTNKYTVIGDDDGDDSTITLNEAYTKMKDALQDASNIGVDTSTPATVKNNGDGSFTITQGKVEVAKDLSFNLHVGSDADMTNKITVNISTMNSSNLGIKGLNVNDDSGIAGTYAIDAISDALQKVSEQRSSLGAVQNRLEHTIDNLDNVVENTTTAESRIRDTDMASEMVNYSKNNILAQAGQSMLAQANQSTQGVLSLLQ